MKFVGASCGRSDRYFAGKIIGTFIEKRETNYFRDHDRFVNSKASKHHCFHRKDREPVLLHSASPIHIEYSRYLLLRLYHRECK